MQCPHCGKEGVHDIIDEVVQLSAARYSHRPMVKTLCCKKPVVVRTHTVLSAEKYKGDDKVDDWGEPL